MSDFLTFLNTADVDTLTKTPGITPTLAEGLIAARPFETADDCLKVRGMGKGLLARLQSMFEGQGKAGEERGLQTVEPEAAPQVVRIQPASESASQPGPSFGSRVGALLLSLFRGFIRLVALVIIVGGIAALLYYGMPMIRSYLMGPVEQNSAEIIQLRSELESLHAQVANLESGLAETNSHVEALESSIAAQTASLAKLEEMQTQLSADMQAGDELLKRELARDLTFTQAIQYLSRARLYLSQSNFGLARNDVLMAREKIADIQINEPDFKPGALKQVLMRLDLAAENLPGFPVVAVSDVDIALELLMSGLPEGAAVVTPTPTPVVATPTMVPTSAPVVDPTITPTTVP